MPGVTKVSWHILYSSYNIKVNMASEGDHQYKLLPKKEYFLAKFTSNFSNTCMDLSFNPKTQHDVLNNSKYD